MRLGKRVKRNRRGEYELHLPPEEKELLRSLPGQLLALLDEGPGDEDLVRLFPPAYAKAEDRDADREYHSLMGSDLLERHKDALRVMGATLDAERLDESQMSSWLNALNELRLVLGTRLNVSENQAPPSPGDPDAAGYALYGYLTWLQQQIIDALSVGL